MSADPSERGICWSPDADERDKGVEPELLSLITAILIAEKPKTVCETGAFPGTVTKAIGAARIDLLHDDSLAGIAVHSWENQAGFAEAHWESNRIPAGGTFKGTPDSFAEYDVTILDSSPYGLRDEEFFCWWDTAKLDSLLIVHDVLDSRWRKPWELRYYEWAEPDIVFGSEWGIGLWRR